MLLASQVSVIIDLVSFFALFFALMLEQIRPSAADSATQRLAFDWTRICARSLDAGRSHHGWLVWICAVLSPACLVWLVYLALLLIGGWIGAVLAFVWSVVVLYFTIGFRRFSHHFSAIRLALDGGDFQQAIVLLAQWKQVDVSQIQPQKIALQVMEYAVIHVHRHVFAVLGWYAVLAALGFGPAGAVLYHMAELVSRYFDPEFQEDLYDPPTQPVTSQLKPALARSLSSKSSLQAALTAWHWMDFVPARATAMAFAVVGNFEEVVEAWRHRQSSSNDALIQTAMVASLSLKETAQPEHLRNLVGLVWRSVVLWLLLIALLTLARLLG